MRDNALGIFPPQAFEEDVVFRKFFGRRQIIISRPAAIQHILVDNPEQLPPHRRRHPHPAAVARQRAAAEPGRGLAASAPHPGAGLRPAHDADPGAATSPAPPRAAAARLEASCAAPVDLLAAMQFLALEIAGASMFSLEMERYGAELRGLITGYAAHLGRPSLLDFLLPPAIPSPRDVRALALSPPLARPDRPDHRRAPRHRPGSAAAPRDLFDLLSTARDPESGALFPPDQLADQVATMIVAGHETTAVALFWSLYLLAGGARRSRSGSPPKSLRSISAPDHAAEVLPTARLHPRRRARGAAALSAGLHAGAPGARRRYRRRHPDPGAHGGADRALGIAPPPPAVGPARNLRPRRGFCPMRRRPTASPICRSASARACASAPNSR